MSTMVMTLDERNRAIDMMLGVGGYDETPHSANGRSPVRSN